MLEKMSKDGDVPTSYVAAASTVSRKRAIFYNALEYAVELGHLPTNPIPASLVRSLTWPSAPTAPAQW